MDSVVIFASNIFRKHAQALTSSHHAHALLSPRTRTSSALTTHKLSHAQALLSHALLSAHASTQPSSPKLRSAHASTQPRSLKLRSAHASTQPLEPSSDPLTSEAPIHSTPETKQLEPSSDPLEPSSDPLTSEAPNRSRLDPHSDPLHSDLLRSTPIRILTHTPIHSDPVRSTPIQAPIQSTLTVSFLNTFLTPTSFFSDPFSVSPVLMFFHF